MRKRYLVFGIVLLFICTSITPSSAFDNRVSSGNTLYVGGSGPGNYTTIQSAIDDSVDGDTIFVYHGIYTKNDPYDQLLVLVNKAINLIGEDKNTTILKGSGRYGLLTVAANGVSISGFTLQESGGGTYPGSCIFIEEKNDIIIRNNIITKNPNCGIYCLRINNCSFFNNILSDNECGFFMTGSVNCSVFSNLFIENTAAMSILEQGELNIMNNEIRNNRYGISIGNCLGVNIFENNFIKNIRHATYAKSGFLFYFSDLKKLKQDWYNNYWDNWHKTTRKPILGKVVIFIWLPNFHLPILFSFLPSFEFDKTPVIEPYDIQWENNIR